LIRSFVYSLGRKKRDWIRHSCSPKSIPSLKIFVEKILKHWGPKSQRLKDTYHELLTALEEEDLLGLFEGNEDDDKAFLEEEDPLVLSKEINDDAGILEDSDDFSDNVNESADLRLEFGEDSPLLITRMRQSLERIVTVILILM